MKTKTYIAISQPKCKVFESITVYVLHYTTFRTTSSSRSTLTLLTPASSSSIHPLDPSHCEKCGLKKTKTRTRQEDDEIVKWFCANSLAFMFSSESSPTTRQSTLERLAQTCRCASSVTPGLVSRTCHRKCRCLRTQTTTRWC